MNMFGMASGRMLAIAAAVVLVSGGVARAVPRTWSSSGTTANLNLAGNWDALPVSGSDAFVFGAASPAGTTLNNDLAADFSVQGITFNAGAAAFTIGGARLTLAGNVVNNSTAAETLNTAMILGATRTFDAASGNLALGGVLGGASGGLTKAGAGTLTLTAASTFGGTAGYTVVNAGILKIGTGGSLYSGLAFYTGKGGSQQGLEINTGGTVETRSWEYGAGNALSELRNNYYSVLINGGILRFADTQSGFRAFTVGASGATLEAPAGVVYTKTAGTTASQNIIRFLANSTLTLTGEGTGTLADGLAPASYGSTGFAIAKTGLGTWSLSGVNRYTGNTTVSGGTLKITGTGRVYSAAHSTAVVTVQSGGTLELDSWAYDGATQSLGMLASGAGQVVVNNGTIRVNGTTTYGRGVTINSGGAIFEAAAGANWTWGGVGYVENVYSGNPAVTLTGAGNGQCDKLISGSGVLTKSGAGKWTINANNTLTGNARISGGTLTINLGKSLAWVGATKSVNDSLVISGGATVEVSYWGAWGDTGPFGRLNYNDGYLRVDNGTIRMMASDSGANRGINIGAGGVTLEAASGVTWALGSGGNTLYGTGALTLAGAGTGVVNTTVTTSGGLVKTGTGAWTLTGANTYGSGTAVNNGLLLVNNASGSGTGAGRVLVNDGGLLGGTGTIGGVVTNLAGSVLAPGGTSAPAVFAVGTKVRMEEGSTLHVNLNGDTPGSGYDQLNLKTTGALELSNATLQIAVGTGYTPPEYTVYTIVTGCASMGGTFDGLADGGEILSGPGSFHIRYNSGAGTITLEARRVSVGTLFIVR